MKHHLRLLCSVLILSCLLSTFVFAVESSETDSPIVTFQNEDGPLRYDESRETIDSLILYNGELCVLEDLVEEDEPYVCFRLYTVPIYFFVGGHYGLSYPMHRYSDVDYVVVQDYGEHEAYHKGNVGMYRFSGTWECMSRTKLTGPSELGAQRIVKNLLKYAMKPELVFKDPSIIHMCYLVDLSDDSHTDGHYALFFATSEGDYVLWFDRNVGEKLFFMTIDEFYDYATAYKDALRYSRYLRYLEKHPDDKVTYEEFGEMIILGGYAPRDFYMTDYDYDAHRFKGPINPCDYHSASSHTEQKKSCASSLSIAALLPAIGATALAGMTVRRKEKGKH